MTAVSRCRCRSLATVVSQGLPIKIIVMNNGYLGMVRQWQELFYNNRLSSVTLDTFPQVELLAAAYGFKGRTVENPSELARGAGNSGCRAGSVPAEYQGHARLKTCTRWCRLAARSMRWFSARHNPWPLEINEHAADYYRS